ncbi:Endonuclease iii-like protein, partial [Thalictrum thalictroides]
MMTRAGSSIQSSVSCSKQFTSKPITPNLDSEPKIRVYVRKRKLTTTTTVSKTEDIQPEKPKLESIIDIEEFSNKKSNVSVLKQR